MKINWQKNNIYINFYSRSHHSKCKISGKMDWRRICSLFIHFWYHSPMSIAISSLKSNSFNNRKRTLGIKKSYPYNNNHSLSLDYVK